MNLLNNFFINQVISMAISTSRAEYLAKAEEWGGDVVETVKRSDTEIDDKVAGAVAEFLEAAAKAVRDGLED